MSETTSTTISIGDDTDTVAERIFREADGDSTRVAKLVEATFPIGGSEHMDLYRRVHQKFTDADHAAAERILAEACGDRECAFKLAGSIPKVARQCAIESLLRNKFRKEDEVKAAELAERIYTEVGDDPFAGYRLARTYPAVDVDDDNFLSGCVVRCLQKRFVAETARKLQIENRHPYGGKRIFFRSIDGFNNVGIEKDGRLINPNNYPADAVMASLYRYGAEKVEGRIQASLRAVATRARRREKLIHEIANGINNGKKYGPRSSCICCEKDLSDPVSIERGLGSECWGHIISAIEDRRDRKHEYAAELRAGKVHGPSERCLLCYRGLSDRASIDRGFDAQCWAEILDVKAAQ